MARQTMSIGGLHRVIAYNDEFWAPINCSESAAENAVFGSDASGNFRPTTKFWDKLFTLLTKRKLRNANNVVVKTADGFGNPVFVED